MLFQKLKETFYQKRSTLWIISLVAAVVLPTLALSGIGFFNIQERLKLSEHQYLAQLNKQSLKLQLFTNNHLKKKFDHIMEQVKTLEDFPINHPINFDFPNFNDSTLKGIVIKKQGLTLWPKRPLLATPHFFKIPKDEIRLRNLETESFRWKKVLQYRLQKDNFLSENERIWNQVGILRLLFELRFFKDFHTQKALLNLDNSSLSSFFKPTLALQEFDIFLWENNSKAALQTFNELWKAFYTYQPNLSHNGTINTLEQMLDRILSLENLSDPQRDQSWNKLQWLRRFKLDASNLRRQQHWTNNFFNTYDIEEGIQMLEVENNLFFQIPLSQHRNNYFFIATFDKIKLIAELTQLLKKFPISFQISLKNQSLNYLKSEDIEFQQSIQLASWHPFNSIEIFRKPESSIQSQALHKAFLLYSTLALASLMVLISIYLVYHTVKKEQTVVKLKTNILSSVTHELKTPLTSINMFAEMISRGKFPPNKDASTYSERILKETLRLQELIDSILNLGKLENENSHQYQYLSLPDLIQGITSRLTPQFEAKKISFVSDLEGFNLWGEHQLLESMFQNLIDNALKYTPEGGNVRIESSSNKKHHSIQINDSGIGIEPKEFNSIFDPFYRVGDELTRQSKGSGIGLAIVKRVAELHKATVSVQSKKSQGSTFKVCFKRG
jgi:signal transduction histidine kinase